MKRNVGMKVLCMILLMSFLVSCKSATDTSQSEGKGNEAQQATEATTAATTAIATVTEDQASEEVISMEELCKVENTFFNHEVDFTVVKELVQAATDNSLNEVWRLELQNPLTELLIEDKSIYFGDRAGNMYAYNADTHEPIWQTKVEALMLAPPISINDTTLLFTADEKLYAVEKKTGEVIWSFAPSVTLFDFSYDYDFDIASPLMYEDSLYWMSSNGKVYCINPNTAEVEWLVDTQVQSYNFCTPYIYDNKLYANNKAGDFYVVDLASKTLINKGKVGITAFTGFTEQDGVLFSGNARSSGVYAIDANTFKVKWQYNEKYTSWMSGGPIIKDNILYIGSSDTHIIYGLDVETGEKKFGIKGNFNTFSTPVIDGDVMYIGQINAVGNAEGNLLAYSLEPDHKQLWCLPIGPISNNVTLHDGLLYVPSHDGKMWVIDPKAQASK